MLARRTNQKGMTTIGVVIVFALIAFFTLITLRLAPLYYDNYKINTHLQATANDLKGKPMTPAEIRSTLLKRLDIDNVKNITGDDIKIVQDKEKKSLDVNYEARVPFVANVDFIAKFTNHIEVPNR